MRGLAQLARGRAAWLLLFLALAVALKLTTYGDLNRHADETFYFLVGQRMHQGLLPYVDVWDRKPLGLFLVYYLIAGLSFSVLAYQIIATLFAALTALLIALITARWTNRRGGILAGIAYLLAIQPFEGDTGQTPDFYNPLIAGAVLLVMAEAQNLARREVSWRTWGAMGLCGLALTLKQTTLFESAFLGLWILVALWRAGTPMPRIARTAILCCLIGIAPTVAIALFYVSVGHWPEFWHAMVLSNLAKVREGQGAWRALSIAVKCAPLLILAAWGLLRSDNDRNVRIFLLSWLVAALVGFVSVPNFYGHYLLPVLVPLSVAAGLALARARMWLVAMVVLGAYSLLWYSPFAAAATREDNRAMRHMAQLIRQHDPGGGLVVFDGPVYLYALSGERFLSPLVFPQHLNHEIERNVSHLDTDAQIDRIIAGKPGVIVMSRFPRSFPVNRYSRSRILEYAHAQCRVVGVESMPAGAFRDTFVIFGDCGKTGNI